VIGSVVVALVTTLGTIYVNSTGIKANTNKLDALKTKIEALDAKADALKKTNLPIGTVVASLLAQAEFAKESGDPDNFDVTKSKWTLADGKAVSGTGWAALRDNAPVPDLRGVFLRGKKNSSKREEMKNVGDFALGEYQADKVGPHQHAIMVSNSNGTPGAVGILYSTAPDTYGPDRLVAAWNDGPETLPKNVTVNYYIKIND
jgi:hypothetical protein